MITKSGFQTEFTFRMHDRELCVSTTEFSTAHHTNDIRRTNFFVDELGQEPPCPVGQEVSGNGVCERVRFVNLDSGGTATQSTVEFDPNWHFGDSISAVYRAPTAKGADETPGDLFGSMHVEFVDRSVLEVRRLVASNIGRSKFDVVLESIETTECLHQHCPSFRACVRSRTCLDFVLAQWPNIVTHPFWYPIDDDMKTAVAHVDFVGDVVDCWARACLAGVEEKNFGHLGMHRGQVVSRPMAV